MIEREVSFHSNGQPSTSGVVIFMKSIPTCKFSKLMCRYQYMFLKILKSGRGIACTSGAKYGNDYVHRDATFDEICLKDDSI